MFGTTFRYWKLDLQEPLPLVPFPKHFLPSDSCYREDLATWKENKETEAQEWKEKLEVLQRRDQSLREAHAKNHPV